MITPLMGYYKRKGKANKRGWLKQIEGNIEKRNRRGNKHEERIEQTGQRKQEARSKGNRVLG